MALARDSFSKVLKSNLWFFRSIKFLKIQKKYEVIGHTMNFFLTKNYENPLTHYVIRANFVSNFRLLKNCYRLWVMGLEVGLPLKRLTQLA